MESRNELSILPPEILIYIFSMLSLQDSSQADLTCKQFNLLMRDNFFWRKNFAYYFSHEFAEVNAVKNATSWYAIFPARAKTNTWLKELLLSYFNLYSTSRMAADQAHKQFRQSQFAWQRASERSIQIISVEVIAAIKQANHFNEWIEVIFKLREYTCSKAIFVSVDIVSLYKMLNALAGLIISELSHRQPEKWRVSIAAFQERLQIAEKEKKRLKVKF